MTELVGPIVEVIKLTGRQAKKYVNYHRNFKDYEHAFRQAQEDLKSQKEDVEQQLQDELCFGKKPKHKVDTWIKKVEEKLEHAHRVEDKISKGKCLFRSCLGKLVDKTTKSMKEVCADGHFSGRMVVNDPSTTNLKLPTEELANANKVEEIYQYLMGDDVRKIGVYGMGGIGKTTTMKHVHNKLLEENKFGKLIWITVSQNFNIRRLQEKIASELQQQLSGSEDTIKHAATLSAALSKQQSYVLILDDVWTPFSLVDIGIPEPTKENGGRLVLTTRSKEVVRSMGCKGVEVGCLSADEAWELFLSKVGDDLLPNSEIESTMKNVAEECDGLPLAIVTIAATMRGISDFPTWRTALKSLRDQTRIEDKVRRCLAFSYDQLNPTEKDRFLWCALYPEDFQFAEEHLIEHWMEDGLLDGMGSTREEMHDLGHVFAQKLKENCLVERGYIDMFMKMHDVVRDMALYVNSPRCFVRAGKQLSELPDEQHWTDDLEIVSLMRNSIAKVPPSMLSLKCKNLTTLLLSHNSLEEVPDCFFDYTLNLRILDLSHNPIANLPSSVSKLEKLSTLLAAWCYKLKNVPPLGKLKSLKKLVLQETRITETPKGLDELVNLKYLDLGFTNYLVEFPSGLLPKLYNLQFVVIHPAKTKVEEISELKKLECFEGCHCLSDFTMHAAQRRKVQKFFIAVAEEFSYLTPVFWKDYTKLVAIAHLDINYGDRFAVADDIQQLVVFECNGVSLNGICELKDATNLKECEVQQCDELESMFLSGETLGAASSSLKKIRLTYCGKMKNLFSGKWLLPNLEDIYVGRCEELIEIIAEEEGMSDIKYTLPKLRELTLSDLPKLKSICSKNGEMACDSLQKISITECPKLKRISLYLPLLDSKPTPPPSLMMIYVEPKESWESMEWDHPEGKNVLLPFLKGPRRK